MLREEHIAADRVGRTPPADRQNTPATSPPNRADSESASATPPTSSSAPTVKTRSSVSDEARVSSNQAAPRQRQREGDSRYDRDQGSDRGACTQPGQYHPAHDDGHQDAELDHARGRRPRFQGIAGRQCQRARRTDRAADRPRSRTAGRSSPAPATASTAKPPATSIIVTAASSAVAPKTRRSSVRRRRILSPTNRPSVASATGMVGDNKRQRAGRQEVEALRPHADTGKEKERDGS